MFDLGEFPPRGGRRTSDREGNQTGWSNIGPCSTRVGFIPKWHWPLSRRAATLGIRFGHNVMNVSVRSHRFAAHLVAAVAVLVCALLSPAAWAVTVSTEGGLVEGAKENSALVFKGIPFAAPPIGPLRWRPPAPAAPWQGVRSVDRFSPICMQPGAYPDDAPPEPMSEDCLYLNVWTPAGPHDGPLPVMFWIHGGGLLNGTASTPLYAGDALTRRDVIVVTANYRLGGFGFLAHPDLSRESQHHVSGNYGLLDQLAALGWVQRNIAAFGGDPTNVTVFGQSSGSISISVLVSSPQARGLFQRAIGQSGGLFEPIEVGPEFTLKGAEQIGEAFAARLGAPSLQALRALPASKIVAQRFYPQPNIDGFLLHESPYEAHAHGRVNDVDILLGSNTEEGLYFASGRSIGANNLRDVLEQDFPSFIVSLIGPKQPADDLAARAAFVAFESDMRFGWDMWAWARLHADLGRRNTFLYRFSHRSPGEQGASHGAEMAYVFGHLDLRPLAWAETDRRLADTMASYWTNFAKTGDPNAEGLPHWPAFKRSTQRALLVGDEIRAGEIPNKADIAAIDRLYGAVRGVLEYGYVIAGLVGFLVLALLGWVVARFRRRKTSSA